MTRRIKDTDFVMLDPLAPYRASQRPPHIKGEPFKKTSSNYCKHPQTRGMWIHFDYKTLSILGKVMTKGQMLECFTKFIEECPSFGSKGGTRSDVSAKIAFNFLFKEGLIILVDNCALSCYSTDTNTTE